MLEKDHGHIISIASAAGLGGVNGLCDYSSSKFGAVGFQESLYLEVQVQGKFNVHTTLVCPYYINTGMFDGIQTKYVHDINQLIITLHQVIPHHYYLLHLLTFK